MPQCRRSDIVIPMDNLLEYSDNYSMTSAIIGEHKTKIMGKTSSR